MLFNDFHCSTETAACIWLHYIEVSAFSQGNPAKKLPNFLTLRSRSAKYREKNIQTVFAKSPDSHIGICESGLAFIEKSACLTSA